MGARPHSFQLSSQGPLRLYSTMELLFMDPPQWLVDGLIPSESVVGLYAPPESLKSFLAIDLAMCVATGVSWQGHEVQKGFVVYISAEGGRGIGKRAAAWLLHHEVEPTIPDLAWITETVNVNADSIEVAYLLDRLEHELERQPTLIVIDTLARCFVGNENEQEDMGAFIAGVDVLRRTFNCCVMIVHHTRLDGERERGNTSFRGAADTMIALNPVEFDERGAVRTIEIKCAKQKDDEHFDTIVLQKRVVAEANSCVLVSIDPLAGQRDIIEAMLGALDGGPLFWSDWVETMVERNQTKADFIRHFQTIRARKLAVKLPDGRWARSEGVRGGGG